MSEKLCRCGKPELHYNDAGIQWQMEELVQRFGEHITIEVGLRKWLVPRHYVALHGVRAIDLPTLGFPEIGPDTYVMDWNPL